MVRKTEEEGYVEIGRTHVVTMQHVDNGETETVTKVGVNEEPTFRGAALSKKVAGMTVRVLAREDNRVVEGSQIQFASKKVKQVEEEDGAGSVSALVGSPHRSVESAEAEKPNILKNFVDKLADRLNIEIPQLHKSDKITIAIAAAALAFGIAALAVGLSKL